MNRQARAQLAVETMHILEQGEYDADGRPVSIRQAMDRCVEATCLLLPGWESTLVAGRPASRRAEGVTNLKVNNETSLEGVRAIAECEAGRIGVLNFASARNPGGGFLSGSQAQEESLARSSALYASLASPASAPFYDHHRSEKSALYTDRIIVSPDCPIIRDDDGLLLPLPQPVTFLTCAAPNLRAIRENQPESASLVADTFRDRIKLILLAAEHAQCEHLVLGAWGCGVFGNSPAVVANAFAFWLAPGREFANRFGMVRFSVLDTSADAGTIEAFQAAFPLHSA